MQTTYSYMAVPMDMSEDEAGDIIFLEYADGKV